MARPTTWHSEKDPLLALPAVMKRMEEETMTTTTKGKRTLSVVRAREVEYEDADEVVRT